MSDYGYADIYAQGLHIITKTLTLQNTEYALGIAAVKDIKRFTLQCRQLRDIRIAIAVGETATNYITLKSGSAWAEWETNLDDKEIYLMDAANAGSIVEVIYLI